MEYAALSLGPHTAEYRAADEEECQFDFSLLELSELINSIDIPESLLFVMKAVSVAIKNTFNGEIKFSSDVRDGKILSKTYRPYSQPFSEKDLGKIYAYTGTTFQFIFDITDYSVNIIVFKSDSIDDEYYSIDHPVRPSVILSKLDGSKKISDVDEIQDYLKSNLINILPSNTVFKVN